jgi:hypothetical protein
VPALTPVTQPVIEPTDATGRLELLHVPPNVALVRHVVTPAHTEPAPVIAEGLGCIVTTVVIKQVVGNL